MILDATTKSLQVVLAAPVNSDQLSCVASWADITTSTFTPGSSDVLTNNTTAVTLVTSPAASTQRQIKTVYINNADTASATVTVMLNSSSTLYPVVTVTLQPDYTLQFGENGWSVMDDNGNALQAAQSNAAGANMEIQFNNGGTLDGDPNLTWNTSNGTMTFAGATPNIQMAGITGSPLTPASGSLSIFAHTVAGRLMAAQIDPTGLGTSLQPILARNKIGYWDPPGGSATVPGVLGFNAPTAVGTATSRTVTVTNLATRMRRLGYVSATTVGSLAGHYSTVEQFSCGSGANDGSGFFYIIRWIPSDAATVAGERNFIGMVNSTSAPTNVDPSTLINCIGVGQQATDATQLYLFYGGSAAQTPIALGATNFPGSTLSTAPIAYELAIFAPNATANTYYYQVTNISTGAYTTGSLSGGATQIPQNATLLCHRAWACNNATALAVGIDICSVYVETDN